MAVRSPLVQVGGQVQQLPAGDSLSSKTVTTAAVTGGPNSAADVVLASLSIPAGTLAAGSRVEVRGFGTTDNGTTATTVTVWVRVGGTKVTLFSQAMGTTAATGVNWTADCMMTVRVAGAAGSLMAGSLCFRGTTPFPLGTAAVVTVNTTAALLVEFGATMSVANASNAVTAQQVSIEVF